MELTIQLTDEVYSKLEEQSKERGVAPEAMVQWLVGDWLRMVYPRPLTIPQPVERLAESSSELSKIMNVLMKSMLSSGAFKCQVCTSDLSYEDIMKGECPSCGSKL